MRVCLISVEIFAWGKHGGFGRATRLIGRELVKRGVEVFAVVPQRGDQRPVELLDGITVLSFDRTAPWQAAALLRSCDADIYHSEEPSFATYLARLMMPDRKHVVTLRDPRELTDWLTELRHPSLNRLQVLANYLYEDNPLVRRAVRRADRVFCAAEFLQAKAVRKYRLASEPEPLPTPVAIPAQLCKSERPTVCYLARWDRRKRPELFLDLPRRFPHVRFIAVGRSRDTDFDRRLRARYGDVPNLEMPGYLDQFSSDGLSRVLSESWILVNTAVREGLPNAFLEAAAHGCAILSAVDPGGFTSRFGVRVREDDFAAGLADLLRDERWRECGERARAHVRETFELESVIDQHLAIYEELLAAGNSQEPRGPTTSPTDTGLPMSIADLRREYARARLDEASVSPDPLAEFARWFDEALKAEVLEPNAMTLATASEDGAPSARLVLLKGFDERGFVFFTDYRSQKGLELKRNPRAALVFYWPELERQVRITGRAATIARQESEAYFRTRPRSSRISAWVSHQSQVIDSRKLLDDRVPELERRFPGEEVPLPPYWGGFRVLPETMEFWQGRESRLHDRIRYVRDGNGWRVERLSP